MRVAPATPTIGFFAMSAILPCLPIDFGRMGRGTKTPDFREAAMLAKAANAKNLATSEKSREN